jgi:hypothetical protein
MSVMNCPYCQQPNRAGARFCTACGRDMQQAGGQPHLGHKAAGAAAQAAQAAAPVVQQAAAAGWSQSKRGASWLRRVLTLGGRAAYTELFSPEPATAGWMINLPQLRTVQTPIEGAFFVFVVFVLFGWLIIFLPGIWPGAALAVWLLGLLSVNFAGMKRPFFTTLTLQRLLGRRPHTQIAEFYIQETGGNQRLRVEMLGVNRVQELQTGLYLQVYGIVNKGQASARVWWINAMSQDGQFQTTVQTPRLVPLSVALFFPLLLATLAALVKLLWMWAGAA